MRSLFALIVFSLMLLPGVLRADVVNFNIDLDNSTISIGLAGGALQSTPAYGTMTVDLTSLDEPFGTAQITQMNAILRDSLVFDILNGLVQISTRDDDASLNLLTAGPGGNVTGGSFDQLQNFVGLSGTADVIDENNFLSDDGSGPFNLSLIDPALVDFESVQFSKTGNLYTLQSMFSYKRTIDQFNVPFDIEVSGTIVATGFAAVPEPSSAVVSLGLLSVAAMQRRRRINS